MCDVYTPSAVWKAQEHIPRSSKPTLLSCQSHKTTRKITKWGKMGERLGREDGAVQACGQVHLVHLRDKRSDWSEARQSVTSHKRKTKVVPLCFSQREMRVAFWITSSFCVDLRVNQSQSNPFTCTSIKIRNITPHLRIIIAWIDTQVQAVSRTSKKN